MRAPLSLVFLVIGVVGAAVVTLALLGARIGGVRNVAKGRRLMQIPRLLVTAIVFGLAVFVGPTPVAHGATLTVDSTADSPDFDTSDALCDTDDSVGDGPCTLRAAIEQANFDAATDTINFNIAGAGPHTISPGSGLPTIIAPVIIDGTSEPDFAGTPIVELDGTSAGVGVDGLNIIAGSSTVKGLVINRFSQDGISLALGAFGGNIIEGNYIGIDTAGSSDMGNGRYGVNVNHAPGNTIGGTTSAARNVISGNNTGVRIIGLLATGNKVEGNYIGTNATGTADLGNSSFGVLISGAWNNTIGGATSAARNVISGNNTGVRITGTAATGNNVEGNYIGADTTGTADLGNSSHGVLIDNGASNNTIGGPVTGEGNTLAFNGDGVRVDGATTTGNTITGNSIHHNTGLGIDNVAGGNSELPPPVITSAGSASGTACANCTVEVFSDDANEGRTFHGSTTADGNGDWSFPGAVDGPNITATATDAGGNTSQFSQPWLISGSGTPTPTPSPTAGPTAIPTPAPTPTPDPDTVNIYGFDMVPGTSTATSVADVQSCTTLAGAGSTTTIDIIVDQVPAFTGAAGGLGGYSGTVNFNPAVITINSYMTLMLFAAAPAGVPITFGTDPVPDTDGAWAFSQGELGGGTEDGEGVAIRLTVEAVGTGTTTLTLTEPSVLDANGLGYTINNTPSGQIVVGDDCPTPDADGDGVPDSTDNCPNWYNPAQSLPPWPVPSGDSDCDGYPDTVQAGSRAPESFIGTDAVTHCAATLATDDEPLPDAWPLDFDDNRLLDLKDILKYNLPFGAIGPGLPYTQRLDLNADNVIDLSDVLQFNLIFLKSCVP